MAGVRRNRHREAQEAVGTQLQHDGRQHHRATGGRLDVGIGQPSVHRPHRHLDRERGEKREPQPCLQLGRKGVVERDERGFILSGSDLLHDGKLPRGWNLDRTPGLLETNIPGIFAVGDVRKGSIKRVASGVGEGSVAISFVHQYLSKVV